MEEETSSNIFLKTVNENFYFSTSSLEDYTVSTTEGYILC